MTDDPLRSLQAIVRALRDPETGCPWDREQTHSTLRPFVIEEAYEVVEAIEEHPEKIEEELGDLLLQVFLHAQIGSEDSRFSIDSIATHLSEKLVRRHPHVFGDETADTAEEVKKTWEAVKKAERGDTDQSQHLLDSLPGHLPALFEAHKIGKKVAPKNFDWDEAYEVVEKVKEELAELEAELQQKEASQERIEEEMGDLLFSAAQLARKLQIEPESALKAANRKFKKRFAALENLAREHFPGKDLSNIPRPELEALWLQVK